MGSYASISVRLLGSRAVVAVFASLLVWQAFTTELAARADVQVSTEAQLQLAVSQLTSGTTIVLAPGVYRLTKTLWINGTFTNVGIRGATSNRADVVLQGSGMTVASGSVPHGVWVGGNVQGVTIANLTIRDMYTHAIVFNAGTQSPVVSNVRLLDAGEQFIKSNPNGTRGTDNGIVENSLIEYSTRARSSYTNGVDVHAGRDWIIRGNTFRNIQGPSGTLAGPAVLVWNGAMNTLTERNVFVNCARAIAYGLRDLAGGSDHAGGVIRNNIVSRTAAQSGDVGILVADSPGTQLLNNTVFLSGTYPAPIEYRFAGTTGAVLTNNLLDGAISRRDGATGTEASNLAGATSALFVNAAGGDFHLAAGAITAIDRGATVAAVTTDFEGDARPQGAAFDIGADERAGTAPVPTQYQIAGLVRTGAGAAVPGVTVVLSGAASQTAQTSSTGAFAFTGLSAGGTFAVTASKAGYAVSPGRLDFAALGTNVSTAHFTATPSLTTVSLTAPAQGSTFTAPASIALAAAAPSTGTVARVDFYAGPTLVGTDTSAPYAFTWTGVVAGSYALRAVAVDSTGVSAESALVNVSVTVAVPTGVVRRDALASGTQNSRVNTVTTQAFSTTEANELLLAFVGADQPQSAKQTVTSVRGAGLTWRLVKRTNTQMGTAEIWRAFAPARLTSITVTATLSQSAASSITVVSFAGVDITGLDGSGAIGATKSTSSPSGAPSASLVTTRNNSWVFGVGNDWDRAVNRVVGPNQTLVHQFLATVGDTIWVQARTAPTPAAGTTVTINNTAPNTDQYNLAIVEVLAGSGSAPPPGPVVTVNLTSPLNLAAFTAPATVTMTAAATASSGAISQVEFRIGTTVVGFDTTAPYSFTASGLVAGTYGLTAIATHSTGTQVTSSPVTVVVSPPAVIPAEVLMTSPPIGLVVVAPATVTLAATASGGSAAFSKVDFYSDSTLVGTDSTSPYSVTMSGLTEGSYQLTAIATQTDGQATPSVAILLTVSAPAPPGDPGADGALLQLSNLVYQGAFRLPGGNIGTSTFAYGGTALSFNPARGSLFVAGHDWDQDLAEITIPAVRTGSVGSLATASVLQPFADVTDGLMSRIGDGNQKLGGVFPYKGNLYATAYLFYDAAGSQSLSHFVSGLDLSVRGDARGPFKVGGLGAGFTSGYFGSIPANWQAALGGPVLNGQCCIPIISRTSYGPAVSVIDPETIGTGGTAPAQPLVYYPSSNPLDRWEATSLLFNGTSEVRGVIFPEGSRSVLFIGRHGVGAFCYGDGGPCGDPSDSSKGNHAYPYKSYVWAYDARDLAEVRAGRKLPWEVRPYGIWTLTLPYATSSARVSGATYDPATGRIFLTQAFGNGELPVVHVFRVSIP